MIMVRDSGKNATPYPKNSQRNSAGGVAQEVNLLPNKHNVLSSNPSTNKNK
jgi:hypothetical protein